MLRKGQARLRSCAANGCRDQSSLPLLSVRARRCAANLSIKLERSRASPCAKLATHGRCSCGFLEPLTHVLAVSYPRMPLLLATVYSTQRLATENRTRGRCARLDPFGNRHEKSGAGYSGWFTVWKMAQKPVWQCLRCRRRLGYSDRCPGAAQPPYFRRLPAQLRRKHRKGEKKQTGRSAAHCETRLLGSRGAIACAPRPASGSSKPA